MITSYFQYPDTWLGVSSDWKSLKNTRDPFYLTQTTRDRSIVFGDELSRTSEQIYTSRSRSKPWKECIHEIFSHWRGGMVGIVTSPSLSRLRFHWIIARTVGRWRRFVIRRTCRSIPRIRRVRRWITRLACCRSHRATRSVSPGGKDGGFRGSRGRSVPWASAVNLPRSIVHMH